LAREEAIRFLYDEAAVTVDTSKGRYLVVGDLHIGLESEFIRKGINLYSATEFMANKIKAIAEAQEVHGIIVLGDVKESVLYPTVSDRKKIADFFSSLERYDIIITKGNHDPHLDEVLGGKVNIVDEYVVDGYAFLHGHKWPSEAAMGCGTIFAAHNHIAVQIIDENKGIYTQKAWLVAKLNADAAMERYKTFSNKSKLVILPAFNDLIVGTPVNKVIGDKLSPLLRSHTFEYETAQIYGMQGVLLGTPSSLRQQ
jgi:hypothetical protein